MDFGGGAPAKRIIYRLLGWLVKLSKNFVPKSIRDKLKLQQCILFAYSYNVLSADEYITKFHKDVSTYMLGDKKVYIFDDFYVSVCPNGTASYIHDKYKNILLQSAPNSRQKNLLLEYAVDIKNKNIINLEEAVDFAIEWNANYWHFTFTVLDKIIKFEENGYKGKYIVPNITYIKELLNLTGINFEKFIFPAPGCSCTYKVKTLHVVNYCCNESLSKNPCIWTDSITTKKIRDLILSHIDFSDIEKYPKRIFVKRIGSRKITNEEEVENYLSKYNFKTIIPEEYSVEEQIKHFYAADIVVAPHGANSTNALYMRPNTNYIECFNCDYVNPCVTTFIKINKLRYNMLVPKGAYNKNIKLYSDYNVDLILLDSILYNLV